MCPTLRGSTVSYAGDAHFPKHSLEYSLNFWSQSKKKKNSIRLLPMLLPLFLSLSVFSFVWSLLIHYHKYRCGPQGRGRLHLLHILCSNRWAGAPAGFPESQGHTSSVSTPVAKPF